MDILIRREYSSDVEYIHQLNQSVFGDESEAVLVDRLRDADSLVLSMVAEIDGRIIGHICFSPAVIEQADESYPALAMAPMSIASDIQHQGLGSMLVNAALEHLRQEHHKIVVVLGHPGFYGKLGFKPAAEFSIHWDHDVPDEAFMVYPLTDDALDNVSGTVHFRPEFEVL